MFQIVRDAVQNGRVHVLLLAKSMLVLLLPWKKGQQTVSVQLRICGLAYLCIAWTKQSRS